MGTKCVYLWGLKLLSVSDKVMERVYWLTGSENLKTTSQYCNRPHLMFQSQKYHLELNFKQIPTGGVSDQLKIDTLLNSHFFVTIS